jgi:hypothetical protein
MEASNVCPIVLYKKPNPKPHKHTIGIEREKENVLLKCMKDNIILHIRDCKRSKKTWDTLKSLYEKTNKNRFFYLKTNFFPLKRMRMKLLITLFFSRIK